MTSLTSERISELVVEALERTAFVLVDDVDVERAGELPSPTHCVKISFSGAATGDVFLAASEGFVVELASSILGVEPDEVDSAQEGADAISELTNIVGGSIILELGGDQNYIHYGLPMPIESDQLPDIADDTARCFLECDDELLTVFWIPIAEDVSAAA